MKSRSMRLIQGAAVASTLAASVFTFVGGTASVANAASKKFTVAYVVGAASDPFFLSMKVGASAEAKKLGINLVWQGNPSVYSSATQIPIVQTLLATKPSALVLAPTDTKALQPLVSQYVAAKIPVFNVDSGDANQGNITSWVTGNNLQGGQSAADSLAAAMGYAKNCTAASKCVVAIGVSSITTSTDAARLKGFGQEIAAKYPNIKALNPIVSNSQPAVATSGFKQALAANKVAGIFAIDGTDLAGAAEAILTAGGSAKNIKVVGYDAYAANIKSMQAGKISAIISQQPALEGKDIIDAVYAKLTGKGAIKHLNTLANIVLTPSNCAKLCATYVYKTA
ncbi:MAG: substrate-binding domain-containing protein [Acidimicrobiaceae bacterium]|nr:substrate-binding domain-containing protein [Acidimicrobiaceae bacterium]